MRVTEGTHMETAGDMYPIVRYALEWIHPPVIIYRHFPATLIDMGYTPTLSLCAEQVTKNNN